jgi:pentose-5-phosphate-3-epimerase
MPDVVTYAGILHSIRKLTTDYHLMIETRRGYIEESIQQAWSDVQLRTTNFVPLG